MPAEVYIGMFADFGEFRFINKLQSVLAGTHPVRGSDGGPRLYPDVRAAVAHCHPLSRAETGCRVFLSHAEPPSC